MGLIAEVGDEDAIFVMMSYLQSHGERAGGESEILVEFNTPAEYTFYLDDKIRRALERAGYAEEQLEDYTFSASLLKWQRHVDSPYQTVIWEGEWNAGKPIILPMQTPYQHRHLNQSWFPLTFMMTFQQENSVEVCLAALDILGHVAGKGNQMAIAAVASCLEDESDDVLWKAVEQLGLIIKAGDHRSILHAKKRLTHEDRRVRWAAQEALGQFMEKSD